MMTPTLSRPLFALLLLLGISFTSCITVQEKITLRKNGSGSQTLTMDMAPMMAVLMDLSKMGENPLGDGAAVFDSMMIKMSENIGEMASVPGISNVQLKGDEEKFTITVSCDFANVSALNRATTTLNALNMQQKSQMPGMPDLQSRAKVEFEGNKFIKEVPGGAESFTPAMKRQREEAREMFRQLEKNQMPGVDYETASMIQSMLDAFSYTTTYEFEQEVKSVKGFAATRNADRHSVTIRLGMKELMDDKMFDPLIIKVK